MKSDNEVKIPTYDSMMNPLIQAVEELGGSEQKLWKQEF